MSIRNCPGCGGILGRDCFNTEECQEIAADIAARQQQEDWRFRNGADLREEEPA